MLTALLSSEFLSNLLWKALKYLFKKYRTQTVKSLKGENSAGTRVIRRRKDNQTAIIFIHGFGGDATATWGDFPKLITEDNGLQEWDVISVGYNTGLMPDLKGLWAAKPDIQKLADYLRTLIVRDFAGKYRRVALVAHSMGGLVTQRALLDLNTELRTRLIHGVLLFGTPSAGLRKAHFGRIINSQIRNLGQGSTFIEKLRADWAATFGDEPPFSLVSVAGDLDEFVPSDSSLLPFTEAQREITVGNHVEIVKPTNAEHLSYQILQDFLRPQHYQAPSTAAAVALELGRFQDVLQKLGPIKDELDRRGQINYALALAGTDCDEEAVAYLSSISGSSNTDAMGTLGGRYKRRWLVNNTRKDAEEALQLYTAGYTIAAHPDTFRAEQVYYHAINLAFLHLLYHDDPAQAREYARIAIEHARHEDSADNHWKWATLGEAHLYLKDGDRAFEYYQKALETGAGPRERNAMYLHWHALTERLGMREVEKKLELLFHSFA